MNEKIFYKYKVLDDYTKDSLKQKFFYYSRQEQCKQVNQKYHVLSLTPLFDNDAMWALYENNYKGITIGYKAKQETENNYYISLGKNEI